MFVKRFNRHVSTPTSGLFRKMSQSCLQNCFTAKKPTNSLKTKHKGLSYIMQCKYGCKLPTDGLVVGRNAARKYAHQPDYME